MPSLEPFHISLEISPWIPGNLWWEGKMFNSWLVVEWLLEAAASHMVVHNKTSVNKM